MYKTRKVLAHCFDWDERDYFHDTWIKKSGDELIGD